MNPKILKDIFREFAPTVAGMAGLTAAGGGGLYGLSKWYDASNAKNLQPPASPKSQHRSGIIKAIADANPNRSGTYEDPVSQEDFGYGRSVASNIKAQQKDTLEQAFSAQAERDQVLLEQAKREQEAKDQAAWKQAANEQNEKRHDAMEQAERASQAERYLNAKEQADWEQAKKEEYAINQSARDYAGWEQYARKQQGTAAPTPNASVDDKTSNNQNGSNSIAASLNNNPGYLMPTAIGQTLIAALLGRLLGGNTGMGLGAIMGLLASPLTASWLAKNNYLEGMASPFANTEKNWFNPNKSA